MTHSPFISQFFEGYGQTETTSVISHSVDIDMTSGHVGVPGGDMEIKLVDVPDLNYSAKDDQGEVGIVYTTESLNVFVFVYCHRILKYFKLEMTGQNHFYNNSNYHDKIHLYLA